MVQNGDAWASEESLSFYILLGVALSLEFVDWPSALDLDGPWGSQDEVLFELDEGSKLGLGVCDVEFSLFQGDFGMLSGDWDISDSNFALVASADLDGRVLFGGDQVQASLLFVLLTIAETFEKDVRFIGLGDSHHLDVLVREADDLGEGELANFTLELGEIVWDSNALQILLHLAIDPSLETSNMNEPAASLAVTGGNQGISLTLIVNETHLAVVLSFLRWFVNLIFADLKNSVGFFEVVGVS